ncbi:hypothetical protein [Streptomyces sp. MMG1533]|uniref:hypothetical protein n=1 Tax=Streptomyces sp. MMG1533 TaxID=1415546 RepID=UPI00131C7485|nr:hypothetical protein [Streptomyces sp. MMG1533]
MGSTLYVMRTAQEMADVVVGEGRGGTPCDLRADRSDLSPRLCPMLAGDDRGLPLDPARLRRARL